MSLSRHFFSVPSAFFVLICLYSVLCEFSMLSKPTGNSWRCVIAVFLQETNSTTHLFCISTLYVHGIFGFYFLFKQLSFTQRKFSVDLHKTRFLLCSNIRIKRTIPCAPKECQHLINRRTKPFAFILLILIRVKHESNLGIIDHERTII